MYSNITCEDLKPLIGRINIIDIRDSYLYKLGCIPSAKNIPVNYLLIAPEKYLDKERIYYIYCAFGIQSAKTCSKLNNIGYKVINVLGGYNSYSQKNI